MSTNRIEKYILSVKIYKKRNAISVFGEISKDYASIYKFSEDIHKFNPLIYKSTKFLPSHKKSQR